MLPSAKLEELELHFCVLCSKSNKTKVEMGTEPVTAKSKRKEISYSGGIM